MLPWIFYAVEAFADFQQKVPTDIMWMCYGILVCFFGARYAATIAVIEAFKISGGLEKVSKCVQALWRALSVLREENKKDDLKDDNNGNNSPQLGLPIYLTQTE